MPICDIFFFLGHVCVPFPSKQCCILFKKGESEGHITLRLSLFEQKYNTFQKEKEQKRGQGRKKYHKWALISSSI